MAVFKSIFTRAVNLTGVSSTIILKSDTINIPLPGSQYRPAQGATVSVTSFATPFKLIDSTANFTSATVKVGDIVGNTTNGSMALVTAIDSPTQLSLSSNLFGAIDSYRLFSNNEFLVGNNPGCLLFFGIGGTVRVLTVAGDDVTLTVPGSHLLPVQVVRIFASTTATIGNVQAYY